MEKQIHKLDIGDPNIEEKVKELHQQMLAASPKRVKKLGKILRSRSVLRLRWFLAKHGYAGKIAPSDLPLFMDYLITQRIDLKDMEPEARKNLRAYSLRNEPDSEKTEDYREHVENAKEPKTCKHCKWFMEKPPGEDKNCVALGTKGIDRACHGFTLKIEV
jgi:hypothetical protein